MAIGPSQEGKKLEHGIGIPQTTERSSYTIPESFNSDKRNTLTIVNNALAAFWFHTNNSKTSFDCMEFCNSSDKLRESS